MALVALLTCLDHDHDKPRHPSRFYYLTRVQLTFIISDWKQSRRGECLVSPYHHIASSKSLIRVLDALEPRKMPSQLAAFAFVSGSLSPSNNNLCHVLFSISAPCPLLTIEIPHFLCSLCDNTPAKRFRAHLGGQTDSFPEN